MATIREAADKYEAPKTMNVADLDRVSTECDIKTETFNTTDGEEFEVDSIEVDGQKYRVPKSVIKQLKTLCAEKPDMTEFKVKKEGTGMNTSYQVIPLD